MNVLILGSGGREHALACAVAKSKRLGKLFVAPGNPGCEAVARLAPLRLDDHAAIIAFCRAESIDLVVVGPEAPLVAGIADALDSAGIACFGPSRAAAQLEGSKGFTKDFCREFTIPTARYERFADADRAKAYTRAQGAPIVVKADGLASGKGVIVAGTIDQAEAAIDAMIGEGKFGAAGAEVVVEEFLEGEEVSFFALCDGRTAVHLASAQDHKAVGEGDTGPNTGGMGAYSPTALMSPALQERVMREIVRPTMRGMAARGAPFKGVLFAGLMLTADGPKLIEFNVRFGDPETEAILPRLEDDVLELLDACARGELPDRAPSMSAEVALCVVLAAEGYPGEPKRGTKISGVERAQEIEGVAVFHAGTRRSGETLFADGGRVLVVTGRGADIAKAQARAYTAVDAIDWPGGFCRRDIGWREIARQRRFA